MEVSSRTKIFKHERTIKNWENPLSKKALAIGGIALGGGLLAYLIYRAWAKPETVKLTSNPIKTAILVDDKWLYVTPATISLPRGIHTFKAVARSPNLLKTFQFDKWVVNGVPIQYDNPTLTIKIDKPTTIRADFILAEAGIYPPILT